MNKRIKFDKGITLISLAITIIVLLILAGVTISMLTGENGILKRAEKAKVVNEYETLREEIALKIMDISTQVIQEEGRTIRISDLSKLNSDKFSVEDTSAFPVIITTEKYEYEINDKFEVSYAGELNGIRVTYGVSTADYTNEDVIITINRTSAEGDISIEVSEGVTKNEDGTYTISENGTYIFKATDSAGNEKTKEITINNIDKIDPEDFTPIVDEITINGFKITANAIDNESGIATYEYHVGDKTYTSTQGEYVVNDLEVETQYSVYVIVTDYAGNEKQSTTVTSKTLGTILQYPLLTKTGMKNYIESVDYSGNMVYKLNSDVTCTASGALVYNAYDGDETTYYATSRTNAKPTTTSGKVWFELANDVEELAISTTVQTKNPCLGVAFFDADFTYISSVGYCGGGNNISGDGYTSTVLIYTIGANELIIAVPEGAKYVGLWRSRADGYWRINEIKPEN